jgi:hypothetical protein
MLKRAGAAATILAVAWLGTACDAIFGSSATIYRVTDFEFDFGMRDACIAQQAANCTFSCSGAVEDPDRTPVAGAVVVVFDDDDNAITTGTTDALGQFFMSVTRPTEGSWQVTVCAADEELGDPGDYGNLVCMYAGQNLN